MKAKNTEDDFIDRIDCNFPYHDKKESIRLIEESATFSTNATFTVIEEICRIPNNERKTTPPKILLELLNLAANTPTNTSPERFMVLNN